MNRSVDRRALGVTGAVEAVVAEVASRLVGVDAADPAACDGVLHDIDGTDIGCRQRDQLQPNTKQQPLGTSHLTGPVLVAPSYHLNQRSPKSMLSMTALPQQWKADDAQRIRRPDTRCRSVTPGPTPGSSRHRRGHAFRQRG